VKIRVLRGKKELEAGVSRVVPERLRLSLDMIPQFGEIAGHCP